MLRGSFVFTTTFILIAPLVTATNLFDCEVSEFYQGFDIENNREVGDVLKKTLHDLIDDHQAISFGQVVGAMIDLDGVLDRDDLTGETVIGIYSQIPKDEFPGIWNREHSWPSARGVGDTGLAHDDLFALFPADASLNSVRSAKFYDECEIGTEDCQSPVTVRSTGEQAAEGTSQTRDTFQPPPTVQGDLARAIFYMATRYDGNDEGTNELNLKACNSVASCGENTFGNLTTLLRWHLEDPVSSEELARINGICSRYQGTRNPYVDFPDLALRVFDENFEFNDEDDNVVVVSIIVLGFVVALLGIVGFMMVMKKKRDEGRM